MTTRKRKQPDKKKQAQRSQGPRTPGLAMRGLTFAGQLASRNPRAFGGSVAFAVVFSFVAANAMWYQPGAHPSPFMRTRLPFTHPEAERLGEGGSLEPRKVTTFVIQREGDTADAEQPEAAPAQDVAADTIPEQRAEKPVTGSVLVADIQKELARRGLYDGPQDGKTGPKTAAAILRFEKLSGRPETGSASDTLLAALLHAPDDGVQQASVQPQKKKQASAAKPAERPYENVETGKGDLDPVAAAIRNAEIDPQFIPKADIPASSELVMNIQKGLTNLAYTDVSVDGVAGEQTRSAIRHFEKHYRLPETGQPSDKVLRKMKEIGAL